MSTTSFEFRVRRRTTEGWATSRTLANGEPGFEINTGRLKIGNGTSSWANLPYVNNVRTGTAAALSNIILTTGELMYATDSNALKIGNGSSTFSALPTLPTTNLAAASDTRAAVSAAGATGSAGAAAVSVGVGSITSATTKATLAGGTGSTGVGGYFMLTPESGSGVRRFTAYRRTTATTQDVVGSVASGTEFDRIKNDYTRVGGNLITNSTFELNTPDTGAYTTPTGYAYNNGLGGGKIVTKPNTEIGSTRALEFAFKTNASSAGYSADLTILQLKQLTAVPDQLVRTGSTHRLLYNVQLNSIASTAITSIGTGTLAIFLGNLVSASGNGVTTTYNFAEPVGFVAGSTGTILTCETLPSGGSPSGLLFSSLPITVAADQRSFSVSHSFNGTSNVAGQIRFFFLTTGQTKVRDLSTIPSTDWQTVAIDTTIPVGFNAVEPIVRFGTINTVGAVIWITGICSVFNRPNLFRYDKNDTEEITRVTNLPSIGFSGVTTIANSASASATSVSTRESIASPWNIGTNLAPNPLLDADVIGTAVPTGYTALFGGVGTVGAVASVESCPVTPFNTNVAYRITHYNDGTNRTDRQLGVSIPVPTALRNIAFTVRCVYYTNIQDSRISSGMVIYRNSDGGSTVGVVATKTSTDGAVNTWFPVVHNVTFTAVAATNSVYIRFVRQQGGDAGFSWGSGVERYSWISGVCFGFNRVNTAYDRKLPSDLTSVANTEAAAAASIVTRDYIRKTIGPYGQYVDSNGVMSPVVPVQQIVAWGDSLTAANWIPNVITSLNSGGATRTGLNQGIGGESSTQILNRIYGYNYSGPTGGNYAASGNILRARRAQPARLSLYEYAGQWTSLGSSIAEPKYVNFYRNGTLIGTSDSRLTADSRVTQGSSSIGATGHAFRNDDIVIFPTSTPDSIITSGTTGTNIFRGKHYYVKGVTDNTYGISELPGGSAPLVNFNTTGTVTALGDFTLPWSPGSTGPYSAISTRTYTDKDTSTAVIWMGANNITEVDIVKADISSAVAHFKTLGKRVVILTPIIVIGDGLPVGPTGTNATISTVPFNSTSPKVLNRNEIGTWILNTYPKNSIDIWAILRAAGDNSVGDNQDITNGGTPRSLRTDLIHLTGPGGGSGSGGYGIVANAVYNFLNTNKW